MISRREAVTQLRAAIAEDTNGFIDAVIVGLASVGSEPEWDSGAIESLLEPIQRHLKGHGIPEVGSTGSDIEALEFWCAVAGEPIPWDPYAGNTDAAGEGWRQAVADGETEMGFTEWWGDRIETARHNL